MRATRRLRELGEKIGNPEQLILALRAAWRSESDMTAAQQIAEQLMEIAQRSGSRYGLTTAHMIQGLSFYFRGELTQAKQHFEATIASYNETDWSGSIMNPHTGALARLGFQLWHLGMAD